MNLKKNKTKDAPAKNGLWCKLPTSFSGKSSNFCIKNPSIYSCSTNTGVSECNLGKY